MTNEMPNSTPTITEHLNQIRVALDKSPCVPIVTPDLCPRCIADHALMAIREQIAAMETQARLLARGGTAYRDQLAALTAERDKFEGALKCGLASAKGLAEVRGHLRDEAAARVATLESTLRQIGDATSEPGIASRVRDALAQPSPECSALELAEKRNAELHAECQAHGRRIDALTAALHEIGFVDKYTVHMRSIARAALAAVAQPKLDPDAGPTLRETQDENL